MTPDNIKLGPGQLFTLTDNGPQLLGTLKDGAEITTETPEYAEEATYLKAAPETVTAQLQLNSEGAKAFGELADACKQAFDALIKITRAAINYLAAIYSGPDIKRILRDAEKKAALKEATPRVRYLAKHAKKMRTRKKNITRALREYRRKEAPKE